MRPCVIVHEDGGRSNRTSVESHVRTKVDASVAHNCHRVLLKDMEVVLPALLISPKIMTELTCSARLASSNLIKIKSFTQSRYLYAQSSGDPDIGEGVR